MPITTYDLSGCATCCNPPETDCPQCTPSKRPTYVWATLPAIGNGISTNCGVIAGEYKLTAISNLCAWEINLAQAACPGFGAADEIQLFLIDDTIGGVNGKWLELTYIVSGGQQIEWALKVGPSAVNVDCYAILTNASVPLAIFTGGCCSNVGVGNALLNIHP